MTEKVKITQEQADVIKRVVKIIGKEKFLNDHASLKELRNGWSAKESSSLNVLSVADMARVLYIGYEIEPEYKVGDWVVKVNGEKFKCSHNNATVVTQVGTHRVVLRDSRGTFNFDFIRHATPEEIKAEKERRKWMEIEPGDVLRGQVSGALAIFIEDFPCHQEVQVRVHDGMVTTWDKDQVELYAKKVGAAND